MIEEVVRATRDYMNEHFGHRELQASLFCARLAKSRKRNRISYTTNRVSNNIALADGLLKSPQLGWIKVKQHCEIPQGYTLLKSVTVRQIATGKHYASMLYEYEAIIQPIAVGECL